MRSSGPRIPTQPGLTVISCRSHWKPSWFHGRNRCQHRMLLQVFWRKTMIMTCHVSRRIIVIYAFIWYDRRRQQVYKYKHKNFKSQGTLLQCTTLKRRDATRLHLRVLATKHQSTRKYVGFVQNIGDAPKKWHHYALWTGEVRF